MQKNAYCPEYQSELIKKVGEFDVKFQNYSNGLETVRI